MGRHVLGCTPAKGTANTNNPLRAVEHAMTHIVTQATAEAGGRKTAQHSHIHTYTHANFFHDLETKSPCVVVAGERVTLLSRHGDCALGCLGNGAVHGTGKKVARRGVWRTGGFEVRGELSHAKKGNGPLPPSGGLRQHYSKNTFCLDRFSNEASVDDEQTVCTGVYFSCSGHCGVDIEVSDASGNAKCD